MVPKRSTYIIAAVSLVLLVAAVYFLFIFHKGPAKPKSQETSDEVKQFSEIDLAKRPYITLTPTSDGAEIIISIENMSSFDKIEYELTYLADNPTVAGEKIQRGATGTDVNTKDQKYKKSILLGTASRGVRSPDKGITEGKLTMHFFIGTSEYLSESDWNLLQVGTKSTSLEDLKGNFKLEVGGFDKQYWVIVADTLGLPLSAEFDSKIALTPIYGVFSVAPEFSQSANLTIKLAESPNQPQLYSYLHADSKWQKLDSTYDAQAKTVSSKIDSFATFVVISSK